jgi:uncharacterized membrane protein
MVCREDWSAARGTTMRAVTRARRLPNWRREALRTTLWFVPALLIVVAALIFVVTFSIDAAAFSNHIQLPTWLRNGTPESGRDVLIAIAAAIITVVGVVFSITILALTLASQQFGPRMMRSFVRDVGNQVTLGVFVATFTYSVLALGSITIYPHAGFAPYLTIAVAEFMMLVDVVVLIYFINHIAASIQLPAVIAGIARDLDSAIDSEFPVAESKDAAPLNPRNDIAKELTVSELLRTIEERGGEVLAAKSGYLQYVGYQQLAKIAKLVDATIRLEYRPGHFIVAGRPVARVFPRGAAPQVEKALAKAHVTGPHRTLTQDPVFAIDQLVEIAIRALSPAVNDTFTALTCLDWISSGLCRLSGRELTERVFRDDEGRVRLIGADWSYPKMVNRAFDKIRQAARGMPAVIIRLLDSLSVVVRATTSAEQREVLMRQGEMVHRSALESVAEPNDLDDIQSHFEVLVRAVTTMNHPDVP